MNTGIPGTGISIMYYLALALAMPLVYLVRLIRRRGTHGGRFVTQHFTYAIAIILMVAFGITMVSHLAGLTGRGQWHGLLGIAAWTTTFILLFWVVLPMIISAWLRALLLAHHPAKNYVAAVAEPTTSTSELLETFGMRSLRIKHLVIDGIVARRQKAAAGRNDVSAKSSAVAVFN